MTTTTDYSEMTISRIAMVVWSDWSNVNYAAKPYLEAMADLMSIDDAYYADTGKDIVRRFLGNATGWRGEVAREVKAELRRRLGDVS